MTPRIVVDLEPGTLISRALPEIDLLDISYGAARGGAAAIILPISETGRGSKNSADLFDRNGLPLLIIKSDAAELDRAAALGSAPDRILITGDRNRTLNDLSPVANFTARGSSVHQEVAALIDPEPAMIKEAKKARAQWVYFPTDKIFSCSSLEEAESEHAKLVSSSLAANRLNLKISLYGPVGRHLAPGLGNIAYVEELAPTPDLWYIAFRSGWESAVSDFLSWLK